MKFLPIPVIKVWIFQNKYLIIKDFPVWKNVITCLFIRVMDIWAKKLIYCGHLSDNISGHMSDSRNIYMYSVLACKVLHEFQGD